MTKEELFDRMETLNNFVLDEELLDGIKEMRSMGFSYREIWRHFEILDEFLFLED